MTKINKHVFGQKQQSLNFWRTRKKMACAHQKLSRGHEKVSSAHQVASAHAKILCQYTSTPKTYGHAPTHQDIPLSFFSTHINASCRSHNTSQQLLLPVQHLLGATGVK